MEICWLRVSTTVPVDGRTVSHAMMILGTDAIVCSVQCILRGYDHFDSSSIPRKESRTVKNEESKLMVGNLTVNTK